MRDLYCTLFETMNLLPDMIAKQNPILLFDVISVNEEPEIPKGMEWFYGQ